VISVIISTYNRAGFIGEAVRSVLAQSHPPGEVIVVDDGSTDGTGAVLAAYTDRIAYIRQTHAGVSAARNRGIGLARGEWLAFLDSDDLWLPGKLEGQLRHLSAHSLLRVAQTEELWLRNGMRVNPRKYHRKPEGHCFDRLLERCLVSPSAVLIHRSIFESVGCFDEAFPACEDYDLWLRIGCRYPIGLLREPLVIKRGGHPGQLSATVPALDLYRIRAIEKLLRSGVLTRVQQVAALEELARKCAIYGAGCRKRGHEALARAILELPQTLVAELCLPCCSGRKLVEERRSGSDPAMIVLQAEPFVR
jgi:glycosyltransferase involved in cell wall biosynthesis